MKLLVTALAAALMLIGSAFARPMVAHAATAPSLGTNSTFGITSSTFTNSNTAPQTIVNGDVCYTTAPTTAPLTITGATTTPCDPATGIDQGTALANLNSQSCTDLGAGAITLDTVVVAGNPAGTFPPGCYSSGGAMDITASATVTLRGDGVYIFRSGGALTTGANSIVTLASGANASNVFWAPIGATTLGANATPSTTATFVGNILSAAGITFGHFANLTGRALAFGGTVTTDANTITVPITLHVIKTVVNDNGGTAVASHFSLHVKLSGTDVANSPAAGTASPGVAYPLAAGTYVVSEDANSSYVQSFSGDCNSGGSITLVAGNDKSCTITNNDIAAAASPASPVSPASINVVKTIVNDNGRTKTVADFPLFVSGTPVTSGETNTFAAPATYTITETADSNYTSSFSGDCDSSGNLSLVPGDVKFCVLTNDDIGASIIVPPEPGLIEVVKVPSPLNLPDGPGLVTYTYSLRNIGTVTVTNITLVGDTCRPITLISGDTNANAELETSETWTYTCSSSISATHTNTVVATGLANGLTATDIASATVVVGSSIVPPLIHVTKIPNRLIFVAKGIVEYTLKITNPGTVALSNVRLSDDKCKPVNYITGDLNSDSRLDTTETWTYVCQATLTKTTTNTAIASGDANGLTARDFAITTVVIATAVPALPKTGLIPEGNGISEHLFVVATIFTLLSLAIARVKK